MKKIKALLSVFAVIFAAVNFTSCDTEPVDPVLLENIGQEPGTAGPAVFKVDFSGETFVATSSAAVGSNGSVAITGIKGTNGQAVSILIDGATVGSYPAAKVILDYSPSGDSEYSYTNVNLSTGQESGTVSISSIDTVNKTISGTFSFVGWWGNTELNLPSIAFTNGVFQNIPYTGTIGGGTTNPEPVEGEDVFKAKVNGAQQDYAENLTISSSGEEGNKFINMTGVNANSTISISVFSSFTAGTYPIGTGFNDAAANFMDAASGNGYTIDNGSITITSNTGGIIKGTFTFLVKDDAGATVYTVTEGAFDVEWDF